MSEREQKLRELVASLMKMEQTANKKTKVGRVGEAVVHEVRIRLEQILAIPETVALTEGYCELCGEPMPEGEEMFRYHGYSGPCPRDRKG